MISGVMAALDWFVLPRLLKNSVSTKRQSALPLISSEKQYTATDGLKASCSYRDKITPEESVSKKWEGLR